MQPRKVKRGIRRPAKPAVSLNRTPKERALDFVKSFYPPNFRAYWLNRQGLDRFGKLVGAGFLMLFLVFLYFAKDLPSPGKINARVAAQTTKFYDRTGNTLLYEVYGDKNRSIIDFNDMPTSIKQATISVEDRSFYKHGAFSALGILRATIIDVVNRGKVQGGSTITQQYVKNALLDPTDRSFGRKIKELIVSLEIEQLYKKDDILKLYLNEIPYGAQAYGIEAACRTYFPQHYNPNTTDKCAPKLTLPESALLAGIPRAPSYYRPNGLHNDDLIARQHLILDLMTEQGYITQLQADDAKKVDVLAEIPTTQNLYANIKAPHFVLYLQEQLEAKYGTNYVTEGGLKIITTLDLNQQQHAQDAIQKNMKEVRSLGGSNAALVSADPKTGQVLSMVGSYDFNDTKFGAYNVASANRQPGSSFKPFAYATAWGQNYGPGTTMYDVPTDFGGGYKPKNFSGRNYGVQSMRTALDGSLNIPAVKTLYMAGVSNVIDTAHRMGITTLNDSPDKYGLSLVLGSGEVKLNDMVNAYESFANGGVHYDPTMVLKITDPRGNVKYEYKKPSSPKRVIDPQVAYLMANVLSDNNSRAFIFGSNSPLHISGRTVAAKTGTTEHYNDGWTMGFTPSLVTGVWAGNNDNAPMSAEAADVAAPIWHDFMVSSLSGPDEQFKRPDGIKSVTLDANTGKLASKASSRTRSDLFPSWYKPSSAADSRSAKVDKVSGKLATDCTPDSAVDTAYSSEIHAEIAPSDPAYSRWEGPVQALASSLGYAKGGTLPTATDDVHNCSDVKPQVSLSASPLGSGNYRLQAIVTSGTFPANKLVISFDDQIISTQSINGSTTYQFNYSVPSNGNHLFKATVTDAGLYQAEDAVSVNVTDAGSTGGALSPQSPSNGASFGAGSLIAYTWSAPAGATQYRLYVRRNNNNPQIITTSNNSYQSVATQPGTYTWYVEAYSGGSLIGTTAGDPWSYSVH